MLTAVRERIQLTGLRAFARAAGVDAANIVKMLNQHRRPSQRMLAQFMDALSEQSGG